MYKETMEIGCSDIFFNLDIVYLSAKATEKAMWKHGMAKILKDVRLPEKHYIMVDLPRKSVGLKMARSWCIKK